MNESTMMIATLLAADGIHEQWRQGHYAKNGPDAPHWKALEPESIAWAAQNGIPENAIRHTEQGAEINIAALPNRRLPPQFSGENITAAKGAIKVILENPSACMEEKAAITHAQWLERNASRTETELKKPYAELPEAEKEKSRAVVRAAETAIARASRKAATKLTVNMPSSFTLKDRNTG